MMILIFVLRIRGPSLPTMNVQVLFRLHRQHHVTIPRRIRYATPSSGIPVGCGPAGVLYDTWFSFTAASTTHTVTISSSGSNFKNPAIQFFSGTCGSLTSLKCGTTTLTATGLTIGSTYYVRVSNIGSMPTSNANSTFDICVTHPNPPPANDNCSGATILTSGLSCNNTTAKFSIRYK